MSRPRPRPFSNLSSARANTLEHQSLTPRTPHSHSGPWTENDSDYAEIELSRMHDDEDDYRSVAQQQAEPLLVSSSSERFPSASPQDHELKYSAKNSKKGTIFQSPAARLSRIPLVFGIFIAGLLFILIVISIVRPATLHTYLGDDSNEETSAAADVSSAVEPPPPSPTLTPQPNAHILSYENYTKFPLLASEYSQECWKLNKGYMSHGGYWEPHMMGDLDVPHYDDATYKLPEGETISVCKSTITYMLDGEVGLAADLALMAQAAALARERNRTFLVDDTYWNRGKWTDHFQNIRSREPGPEPGCIPPPPEELVACPRTARHWVINHRTAKFHFAHAFFDNYEDAYARQLNRMHPIFKAAVESFETTIRPNTDTAQLIRLARSELSSIIGTSSRYVAVHIRRGDRKTASYEFHGEFVPLSDFSNAVSSTWQRLNLSNSDSSRPVAYIATDSPSVPTEFSYIYDGLTFSLSQSQNSVLRDLASPGEYRQTEFNTLDQDVRITATRGMIVDLALISGFWAWDGELIPDATVCTLTSNVCKLAAVGLGWDHAFGDVDEMGYMDDKHKRWVEIDQKGVIVPAWEAFEIF